MNNRVMVRFDTTLQVTLPHCDECADITEDRGVGDEEIEAQSLSLSVRDGGKSTQPGISRDVNGMAHRVDRLKAVGNGQDPLGMMAAYEFISGG